MGRMLELLRTRDESRTALADTKEPPTVVGRDVVTEWSLRDDEVPYIEVGPNKSIAGSPSVMAVIPPAPAPTPTPKVSIAISETQRLEPIQQPILQPPHPPIEQALSQSPLTAYLLEPRPLSVNFEPVTGYLEAGKIATEIIAYHQPNHPISLQYSALIEKLLQEESGRVLLLSGIRPGVGTSTVLLNLAISAAQKSQRRVTVVETQRQRPSLAGKLGVKPLAFLQDVLTGASSLEQALLKSPLPRLALLAASATHPEILLAVEGLTWLLSTLKARNDLVLVDGPSLDDQANLSRLAPLSDAMFLVMPQNEPATQGRPLLQAINRIGGRLRGLLHTQLAGS